MEENPQILPEISARISIGSHNFKTKFSFVHATLNIHLAISYIMKVEL